MINTSEIVSLLTIFYSPKRLSPHINPNSHKYKAKKIVEKLKVNWPKKHKKYFYTFPYFK